MWLECTTIPSFPPLFLGSGTWGSLKCLLNELEDWMVIFYFSLCLIPLVSPIYTHQALWVLSSCCLFPCPLPPHSLGFQARPSSLPVRGPAEASWSPWLQLKTCQVEFWEDGDSRVLRSSQIPSYKQSNWIEKLKTYGHSQRNWIIRFSLNLNQQRDPPAFAVGAARGRGKQQGTVSWTWEQEKPQGANRYPLEGTVGQYGSSS